MDIRLYETTEVVKAVCFLADKVYAQNRRILIMCANPLMVQALDQALWQFKQLSFLPHTADTDNVDPGLQPIFITSKTEGNPNNADTIVCCDVFPGDMKAESLFFVLNPTGTLIQQCISTYKPEKHFVQTEDGTWR